MGIVTEKDLERSYGVTIQTPFHNMSEKINKYHIRWKENLNNKSHSTIWECFDINSVNSGFV